MEINKNDVLWQSKIRSIVSLRFYDKSLIKNEISW